RKHFGNDSALGRRFRTVDGNTLQPGPWRTVVGVVSTVRMLPPFNIPNVDESGFYVPFYSVASGPAQATPFVSQFAASAVKPRGGLRAAGLANSLRPEGGEVGPDRPPYLR